MKKYFNKEYIRLIVMWSICAACIVRLLYLKEYWHIFCIFCTWISFSFGRYSMKKQIREYIDYIIKKQVEFGIPRKAFNSLLHFKNCFLFSKKEYDQYIKIHSYDQYIKIHSEESKRILEEENESFH